jgi:hypothetical protein
VIKVCNEFAGYTRYMRTTPFGASSPQHVSVPRSHAVHPSDTTPAEGAASVRRVVTTLLPRFAEKDLAAQKMCWCTDTADAQLLLCEDPRWKGLLLATGDSGHTFHALPFVGHEVADALEGKVCAVFRLSPLSLTIVCSSQRKSERRGGGGRATATQKARDAAGRLQRTSRIYQAGHTAIRREKSNLELYSFFAK